MQVPFTWKDAGWFMIGSSAEYVVDDSADDPGGHVLGSRAVVDFTSA
ncbi:hypothetical protein JF781_20735 [Mycobacterium sp. WUMAC-067]|nr:MULTISPECIES: hypothetical protein [unclassified Mycobacterium]MCA2244786.1 hypothetical protein [Mycobacterium sp. WUMAC-067]MCA2315996.1 hypothetical protein [Mycobacterium sp. WUMAC-025]